MKVRYFYEKSNPAWAAKTSFDADFGFDFKSENLYVFAFNVGQANCIVLRKGSNCIIIDAGGSFYQKDSKEKVLEGKVLTLISATIVDAVFVTHPYEDHYTLLQDPIFEPFLKTTTKFFLGGSKTDWDGEKWRRFSGNELFLLKVR